MSAMRRVLRLSAQLKLIVQVCKQAWGQTQISVPTFLMDRLRVPSVSAHLSALTCSQTIQGRKYPQCIPQLHSGAFNSYTKATLQQSASINWTSQWCPSSFWRHVLQVSCHCWRGRDSSHWLNGWSSENGNVTFETLNMSCEGCTFYETTSAWFFWVSNPSELDLIIFYNNCIYITYLDIPGCQLVENAVYYSHNYCTRFWDTAMLHSRAIGAQTKFVLESAFGCSCCLFWMAAWTPKVFDSFSSDLVYFLM